MSIKWIRGNEAEVRRYEEEFKGAVIKFPVYHVQAFNADSEVVYAQVWDGETVRDVIVGIAAYANSQMYAIVEEDLSSENQEKVKTYHEQRAAYYRRRSEVYKEFDAYCEIKKGDEVVITKGRKFKAGERFRVEWAGKTAYGECVKIDGGRFCSMENVTLLRPAGKLAEILLKAEALGMNELVNTFYTQIQEI